jgi:Transposase DDE domain
MGPSVATTSSSTTSATVYICPGGTELTSTGNVDQGHIVYYRASRSACSICALKPKCTTAVARKVTRDLDEEVRDHVRALAHTDAFQQSRRERKKVEMRVAHMKRIFKLDRLRLRGLSGAKDEVLLTATAQNLKRFIKFLCRSTRTDSLSGVKQASGIRGKASTPNALESRRADDQNPNLSSALQSNRVLQQNPPESGHSPVALRCQLRANKPIL